MLLNTKLNLPAQSFQKVYRPRLLQLLSQGENKKLTLVEAPAGFGKTTLVVDWLREVQDPYVWFSLEKSDNDLPRFFAYLLHGFQRILPNFGHQLKIQLKEGHNREPENLVVQLINEIETIGHPVRLILEDYYFIELEEIHRAVTFLLEHLPSNLKLTLITRETPPLPLSRMRVREQLVEIKREALKFREEEILQYFKEVAGYELNEKEVRQLNQKTEGWVASLQLIAQTMKGKQQPDLLETYPKSLKLIMSFLVDEVLQKIPPQVRQFLRLSSRLTRFCGALCDAALSPPGEEAAFSSSKEIIDFIRQNNLFLIPLDDEGTWYRYHHLFGELLQKEILEPREREAFHQKASEWFEKQGYMDEAIEHALLLEDQKPAILLIESIANQLFTEQESDRLLFLCDQIEKENLKFFPLLMVYIAAASLWKFQLHVIPDLIRMMRSAADQRPDLPILAICDSFQSILLRLEQKEQDAYQLGNLALEELRKYGDQHSIVMKTITLFSLAEGRMISSTMEEGEFLIKETLIAAKESGNLMITHSASALYGESIIGQGKLTEGLKFLQQLKELHAKESIPLLENRIALIFYERNQLDVAIKILRGNIREEIMSPFHPISLLEFCNLALVENALGRTEEACRILSKLDRDMKTENTPELVLLWFLSVINSVKFTIYFNSPQFSFLLEDIEKSIADCPNYDQVIDSLFKDNFILQVAQVYFCRNKIKEALQLTQKGVENSDQRGGSGVAIRYLILQAKIFDKLAKPNEADRSLGRAIQLAAPERFIRSFVDAGKEVKILLSRLLKTGNHRDYLREIIAAFPETPEISGMTKREYESLIEPLKEREIMILSALNKAGTNQEIASQLYLSVNTVKWYIKNIYGKLGVTKRSEAVKKGMELGLISP